MWCVFEWAVQCTRSVDVVVRRKITEIGNRNDNNNKFELEKISDWIVRALYRIRGALDKYVYVDCYLVHKIIEISTRTRGTTVFSSRFFVGSCAKQTMAQLHVIKLITKLRDANFCDSFFSSFPCIWHGLCGWMRWRWLARPTILISKILSRRGQVVKWPFKLQNNSSLPHVLVRTQRTHIFFIASPQHESTIYDSIGCERTAHYRLIINSHPFSL